MKNDPLVQYEKLVEDLKREKEEIEARLAQINEALFGRAMIPATEPRAAGFRVRKGRGGQISLRSAVIQVTQSSPKTKEEILEGVKKLGYKFSAKNPLNSLNVVLYGHNPSFKRMDGRFFPEGGTPGFSRTSTTPVIGKSRATRKRRLSPEGKARIAEAQKRRWSKYRTSRKK